MIVIPVVGIRTTTHARDRFTPRNEDRAASLRELRRFGFSRVHFQVEGPPNSALANLPADLDMQVQVAADVRRPDEIDELLFAGASFVVVQPPDPDTDNFASLSELNPHAMIAAVKVCDRRVVCGHPSSHNWSRHAADWIEELAHVGVAAVLVDQRDALGHPAQCDLTLLEDLVENVAAPIIASGLLERLGDLDALQDRGVAAALLGEALETGRIDPWAAAREFCA